MEKLSNRKQAVLDVLDEQIEELETKLAKVQPLIDELQKLRRTRTVLLDERSATSGAGRSGMILSMESVIQDLRDNGPSLPNEVADRLGVSATVVRSHFNRYNDQRYEKNGNGRWALIEGEEGDELDEVDEEGEE